MEGAEDQDPATTSLPLPRNHAYLEDAAAVNISGEVSLNKQDGSTSIPVMFLDFVLFPGVILPLRLQDHSIISFLQKCIKNGDPAKLGIVYKHCFSFVDDENIYDDRYKGAIGTVATVTFTHHGGESPREMIVTAIGGNRFEIIVPDVSLGRGTQFYHVQELLPESSPFVGPYLQHLPKLVSNNSSEQMLRRLSMVLALPLERILTKRWPVRLTKEIEELLQDSVAISSLRSCEKSNDPEEFSYWLSANLAIDQPVKQLLLKLPTVAERLALLKRLVQELERSAVLCCHRCQARIAWVKDIVAVPGADGVSGNYVNPHGCVHQTITVRHLLLSNEKNVQYSSGLESKDTWFPGYQWAIMNCASCRAHLGWRFEAESKLLDLPRFFGLSSSQVMTCLKSRGDYLESRN